MKKTTKQLASDTAGLEALTATFELSAVKTLLTAIHEQPNREGLIETPKRYVRFLKDFTTENSFVFKTFTDKRYDEMVCVHKIPFYSLCEHHMLPFFGEADIAYIPKGGKIVGLSKIPRVLDLYARRLQTQERITSQVADFLWDKLKPKGVAVILRARHMCVEMRGVQKPGTITTSSTMLGVFKTQVNTRQEFLKLIK